MHPLHAYTLEETSMSINLEDYFAPATFSKIKKFADRQETPFVVVDLDTISRAYDDLKIGRAHV